MSNKSPNITNPSGGGAQKGLGEKFSPDLFTGTGNFSVPIALPPGRNGFQPELTLGYSTGNGNGAFGLGWNLSVPGVSRKTSRGIPVYNDDEDVFILSGAEDLVRVKQTKMNTEVKTYYRPRTEGLYARIVHCKKVTGENYWEVRSKDGLISYYGNPADTTEYSCAISNPQLRKSIFAWRLYKTVDAFGNHIIYVYDRELVTAGIHEYDQLYLAQIKYGNYVSSSVTKYLVRIQFNYQNRNDAFSEYKQGFEVRTTKRCNSIDIFTCPETADLPEGYNTGNSYYAPWGVNRIRTKTYDFTYIDEDVALKQPLNGVSMLHTVKVSGSNLNDTPNEEYMPPLTFKYSLFDPYQRDFYPIKGNDLQSNGLNSPDIELIDLTGNGLPDILQMSGAQVRWWRNKGNGEFAVPSFMNEAPAGLFLADPNVQLLDANGDGKAELLVNQPGLSGYYSTKYGGTWSKKQFQKYEVAPTFSFEDPEVKMMDLDGDGVTDVLRNGSRFECFFNHPTKGFYKTTTVNKQSLDGFPDVSFSDPRIKTAEMSGDGMQDLVYVHSGNVVYWPNLGYGRFGKRITMRNSPRFPYGFDPKRVVLGDIDGDGLADLIYVENNKVTLWINQSGNAWSDPIVISGTPAVNDMDSVRITDILGSGVSGVLWSGIATNTGFSKLFFMDFTGGNKPYLLQEMNNQMGSITRVAYASSIQYYLKDEVSPVTRWKTEFPFPVLVVSTVEVIDDISKGKLVTEYSYHHGYWDGLEREFRGFGRVDQRDTESFSRYNDSSLVALVTPNMPDKFDPVVQEFYTPPTETKTWFNQGPVGDEWGGWHLANYSHEYWQPDPSVLTTEALVPSLAIAEFVSWPSRARRDALRTLRGTILRTELYALDNTPLQGKPYTVTESLSYMRADYIPEHMPSNTFKYASGYIFFPYQIAQRTTQWERGNDPMTSFSFTWNYDAYGQATNQMSAGVARGLNPLTGIAFTSTSGIYVPPAISSKKYLATTSVSEYIYKGVIDDDTVADGLYMMNRVKQSKAFDCTFSGTKTIFDFYFDIQNNLEIGDILSHQFNYYDGSAYTGLSLGSLGNYGALVRAETLISTNAIYNSAYGSLPDTLKSSPSWGSEYPSEFISQYPDRGGYLYYDTSPYTTGFYVRSTANKYDFQVGSGSVVGLVVASRDPFNGETTIAYDSYLILPVSVTDAEGNTTTALYDYRVLQPYQVTDINNNKSVFDFSPLGLLRASAIIGKGTEGDYKAASGNFYARYEPSTKLEYNFFNYVTNGDPVWVKTIKREYHYQQGVNNNTIVSVEYSDGFGRLIQTRTQAEDMLWGDTSTKRILGDSGLPASQSSNANAVAMQRASGAPLNVVVSGWQIYNNKGKVVEKYEPFFDSGFDFVSPI